MFYVVLNILRQLKFSEVLVTSGHICRNVSINMHGCHSPFYPSYSEMSLFQFLAKVNELIEFDDNKLQSKMCLH